MQARFDQMRTSALFRRLMVSRPLFRAEMVHLDRFVSRAGLELGRDVETVLIGTDGNASGESVALVTGRLDVARISALMKKQGRAELKMDTVTCWVLPSGAAPPGRLPTPETLVALPDPQTAIVGTKEWVRSALDRLAGRRAPASIRSAVHSLVGRVDERATLWSVAEGSAIGGILGGGSGRSPLEEEDLQSIRSVASSFWITDVLRVDSEAATATARDAELLATTITALAAVAGLKASMDDPDLAATLRSLKVDRTAGGVRLRAEIPASIAARL